ncbi:MAG TPA: hypothetical protein VK152_06855 [Paludibacter sp.]|nr:hypothetical protein [Paludibacter sp.]
MKKKAFHITLFIFFAATSLVLALILAPMRLYYSGNSNYLDKLQTITGVDLNGKIKNSGDMEKTYSTISSNLNIPGKSGTENTQHSASNDIEEAQNATAFQKLPIQQERTEKITIISDKVLASGKNARRVSTGVPASMLSGSGNAETKKTPSIKSGLTPISSDIATTKLSNGKSNIGMPPPEEGEGTPPPNLPVGNGLPFLLVSLFVYAGYKFRKILN